jgi:tRNA-Thr(GGU) m(6)t(6)A37 methyltransferase TsaA
VFQLHAIGRVESPLRDPATAPKQGALSDVRVGDRLLVLTWLDRADRSILRVHPRDNPANPLCGVFSTRSADRPNPIGVHRVTVVANPAPLRYQVRNLEALDGTPVVDVKITLEGLVE